MMEEKRISPDHKGKTVVSTVALAAAKDKIIADTARQHKETGKKPAAKKTTAKAADKTAAKKPAAKAADKPAAKKTAAKAADKPAVKKTAAKTTKKPGVKPAEKQSASKPSEIKAPESVNHEVSADEQLPELKPILASGAEEISVPLSAESIRAFSEYARLLKEWNEKMNLTNITDDKGIAIRHFVDSLTLVPHLEEELAKKKKKSLTLIDVGTGAGFPGIPLKVAMPSLEVILLDSLRKRVGFLDAVCAALGLTGITTVHSRAEDAGLSKQYREKFDVATARAVASLPVLCEYCLPFVKVGGIFLAMKGNVEEEAESAKKSIITLGGTIETLHHFTLPGTDMKRSIIVIRKVRATPAKYPRQAGKPEKEPIL